MSTLPKVFIGAASERDGLAEALKRVLQQDAGKLVVRTWRDVFAQAGAGKTTIEVLVDAAEEYDFGVFLLSDEDVTILRGREVKTSRPNVLLEFGLFLGKVGRDRTFGFVPNTFGTELPTDLAGVGFYKWVVDDENNDSAISGDAGLLRDVMIKRGSKRPAPVDQSASAHAPGLLAPPGDGWVEAAHLELLLPAQEWDLYAGDPVVHRRFGLGLVREIYPGADELHVKVEFAKRPADLPLSQLRLPKFA